VIAVDTSLLDDPVFDDPGKLTSINTELTMADRHATRHKGIRNTANGRVWGVNDLVFLLYRPVSAAYERLHQASIEVRYGMGHPPAVEDMRVDLATIKGAYADGQLQASWSKGESLR
jgi:hypothetical protein